MTKTLNNLKHELLSNPDILDEYTKLQPEYRVIESIIKYRLERGWSQTDLARAVGTKQPVISRLERGESNPSVQTLRKIADALNVSLTISLH